MLSLEACFCWLPTRGSKKVNAEQSATKIQNFVWGSIVGQVVDEKLSITWSPRRKTSKRNQHIVIQSFSSTFYHNHVSIALLRVSVPNMCRLFHSVSVSVFEKQKAKDQLNPLVFFFFYPLDEIETKLCWTLVFIISLIAWKCTSLQNGEAGHLREEKHLNLLWLTVFIDTEKSEEIKWDTDKLSKTLTSPGQRVQLFAPDRSARHLRTLNETLTNLASVFSCLSPIGQHDIWGH